LGKKNLNLSHKLNLQLGSVFNGCVKAEREKDNSDLRKHKRQFKHLKQKQSSSSLMNKNQIRLHDVIAEIQNIKL